MKFCTKCKTHRDSSEFYTDSIGKIKRPCKVCKKDWLIEYRKKHPQRTIKTEYSVDYTEMRHPDPAVMEANVKKMIKIYADNEAKINQAHLSFIPNAGLCDLIIGRIEE